MEESGMNKSKGVINVGPRVKVSLRVLPFGSVVYETGRLKQATQEKEVKAPEYIEPLTTNVERAEIRYGGNETFSTPKTTAG